MRFSTWIVLPLYAVTSSALVIPSGVPPKKAIAGSIALSNVTDLSNQTLSALETEYEKLESLKHQIFELHHKVLQQEHEILALINKDFQSCSGLRCYLQTALEKAPDFYQLLKTHFRHHPKNATVKPWDCPWSSKSNEGPVYVDINTATSSPASSENELFHFGDKHDAPRPPQHNGEPHQFDEGLYPPPPPPPPPPPHHGDQPFRHGGDSPPPPPPPFPSNDKPFHFGDGPDPSVKHHPEHHPWDGPSEPNPNRPAGHPPHKGPGPFRMPHPAPRHRHFKLILATAGGVVSVLICGVLLKAARVYLSNPRVRADRAARIEECRTRREYRRAACQHRWRQCLSRFGRRRQSSETDDYEEKMGMLQGSHGESQVESHIVGSDIDALRRAHAIVGQLMRAEEGRMNTHECPALQQQEPPHARQIQPPNAAMEGSSHSVRSLQTMTTLPPYAPPPPRYSQELSRDMEVVDGFRYTPSQSEATITSSASSFILDDADLCTESSVVDCRSRMSMDTESVTPSQAGEKNRKSLELAGDRYRGRFD